MSLVNNYLNFRRADGWAAAATVALGSSLGWAPALLAGAGYTLYRASSACRKRSSKGIVILCKEERGLGDVIFAKKLFERVQTHFSRIDVFLVPFNLSTETTCKLQGISFIPLEELAGKVNQLSQVLTIRCPIVEYSNQPLPYRTIVWDLGEYSSWSTVIGPGKYKSGLYNQEWGIFCEREEGKKGKPSFEHLENPGLKELFSSDRSLSSFYAGYASQPKSLPSFILPIAWIQREQKEGINMVIPGNFSHVGRITQQFKEVEEQLIETGLGKLRVLIWGEGKWMDSEYLLTSATEKTLRLVFPGRIPHKDFMLLNKMSKPLHLATGDQTVSDYLGQSLDREPMQANVFMYEMLSHKSAFFSTLCTLAEKCGLNLAANFLWKSVISYSNASAYNTRGSYREIGDMLANPQLHVEFGALAAYIHENCNLKTIALQNIGSWVDGTYGKKPLACVKLYRT